MSDSLTIDLTKQQRDTLLRGLRFVRSSIMLDMHDPDPESDEKLGEGLKEIASLVDVLEPAPAVGSPAPV
jgi:hypothetical protein